MAQKVISYILYVVFLAGWATGIYEGNMSAGERVIVLALAVISHRLVFVKEKSDGSR